MQINKRKTIFAKIGVLSAIILTAILFLYLINVNERESVEISVDIESGLSGEYQLFFSSSAKFNEKNSIKTMYDGNGRKLLLFQIRNYALESIRFDLGSQQGKISINNISIESKNKKSILYGENIENIISKYNDISVIENDGNKIVFNITGNDPYFEILHLPRYISSNKTIIIVLKGLVILLSVILFFMELLVGLRILYSNIKMRSKKTILFVTKMLKSVSSFKYAKLLSFIIVFAFLSCYIVINHAVKLAGDSEKYWELGKTFIRDGHFSLYNYNCPMRGYFLPLLNCLIMKFGGLVNIDPLFLFRLINSALFSLMLTLVVPAIYENIAKKKAGLFRILFFSIVFLYFWISSVLFPLTDIPSMAVILIAIYFVVKKFHNKVMNYVSYLLIGGAIALSFILRPSCQIVLIPFILYLLFIFIKQHITPKKIILKLTLFFVGMFIIVWPQLAINNNIWGEINPFVPTKYGWVGYKGQVPGSNLYLAQLSAGIKYYRFMQADPHGIMIYQNEKIPISISSSELSSFKDYFDLVIKYPLDFCAIYLRHIFIGMDTFGTSPYIDNVSSKTLFSLINYSLWFFIILFLWNNRKNVFKNYNVTFLLLLLSLPGILAIPTMTENRFFLHFFMIMYVLLVFAVDYQSIYSQKKKYLIKYSLPYVLFVVFCMFISSTYTIRLFGG